MPPGSVEFLVHELDRIAEHLGEQRQHGGNTRQYDALQVQLRLEGSGRQGFNRVPGCGCGGFWQGRFNAIHHLIHLCTRRGLGALSNWEGSQIALHGFPGLRRKGRRIFKGCRGGTGRERTCTHQKGDQ